MLHLWDYTFGPEKMNIDPVEPLPLEMNIYNMFAAPFGLDDK